LNLIANQTSISYPINELQKKTINSTSQTLNFTIDLSEQKLGTLFYNISAEITNASKISLIKNHSLPFLRLKEL